MVTLVHDLNFVTIGICLFLAMKQKHSFTLKNTNEAVWHGTLIDGISIDV